MFLRTAGDEISVISKYFNEFILLIKTRYSNNMCNISVALSSQQFYTQMDG